MRTLLLLLLTVSFAARLHAAADTVVIKEHLAAITLTDGFRNHKNITLLNKTAAYIKATFEKYSSSVTEQPYMVDGKEYKNVICSFGPADAKRIIVGAHYDVCGNQQGADDNASGVVGLLELARLLKDTHPNYRVDLVAYTLEEPPYFETEQMGSYIHAKSLVDENVDVYGMVSLEMIGYFKDARHSQSYPIGLLKLFYGNRGNYITLVRKFRSGKFAHKFVKQFKHARTIRTKKFSGPKSLVGIDLSDHLNYWRFYFSALMVTDTAFYRNKSYHRTTDTMDELDIVRMAGVIDGLFKTLCSLR